MAAVHFNKEHYIGRECSNLDTIFLTLHTVMSMIHRKLLVSPHQEYVFTLAVILFTCTLLLKHFQQRVYHTWRTPIVFTIHLLLTTLRALLVSTMDSKQAIHWRNALTGTADSSALMIITIMSVIGGPFRAFEMLGLQQPFSLHVLVTMYYTVLHSVAAADGCRMAYSNVLFYLVHDVHDGIAALVDTILDALVPLPPMQQATCSSCAGVVVYITLLLFSSIAVPLYLTYAVEQAARKRFYKRMTAAAAAAAAATTSGAGSAGPVPQQQQQAEQQHQQQHVADQGPMFTQHGIELKLDDSVCTLACWTVHGLLLVAMLVFSWFVANALALQLLPNWLSSSQLNVWCPNKPRTPFLIAGRVYGSDY